jgi:hypothetical protein
MPVLLFFLFFFVGLIAIIGAAATGFMHLLGIY